jgi:hypothetical protein
VETLQSKQQIKCAVGSSAPMSGRTGKCRRGTGEAMTKLSDEELRALRLLARSPNGCTEPVMLAHGFTPDQIANLVFAGLARRDVRNMAAGERQIKVVRMEITAAGRKAIAD